jgi:hypothetical protein
MASQKIQTITLFLKNVQVVLTGELEERTSARIT